MQSRGAMADFGRMALKKMRKNEPFVVDDITIDERITAADEAAYRENGIQSLFACH